MMKRHLLATLCSVTLILYMFAPTTLHAHALSGVWTKTFSNPSGTSEYTLLIDSPDEVPSNLNWTITVSLVLNSMTKLKLYLYYATILVTVELASGKNLERSLRFGSYPIMEYPDRLYPGGRWGPNSITFDLAKEDLEITGGSIDASIFLEVDFAENVYVLHPNAPPASTYETFRVEAGKVRIINTEQSILVSYLPLIIGGVTGVTVFTAFLLYNRLAQRSVKN